MKKRYHAPRIDAYRLANASIDLDDGEPTGAAPDVAATGLAAAEIIDLVDTALLVRESALLERVLRELRTSPNPARTVTGLARRLGVGRTTLWREWRRLFGDQMTLPVLLHAELLSRVHELMGSGVSLKEALKRKNMDHRWYRRAASSPERRVDVDSPPSQNPMIMRRETKWYVHGTTWSLPCAIPDGNLLAHGRRQAARN